MCHVEPDGAPAIDADHMTLEIDFATEHGDIREQQDNRR
jgi:hypothetical protein